MSTSKTQTMPLRPASSGKTTGGFLGRLAEIRHKTAANSQPSSPVVKAESFHGATTPLMSSSSGYHKTSTASRNASTVAVKREDDAERLAKELEEAERLERELLEAEREELAQRLEKERLRKELMKAERLEHDRLEQERLKQERLEKERLEKERLERERAVKERLEKERIEKERLEKERLEKERLERERLEREHAEKERLEKERLERERAEKQRLENERIERERLELEKAEREAAEKQAAEQKKLEEEKARKILEERERVLAEIDEAKQGVVWIGERLVTLKELVAKNSDVNTTGAYEGISASLAKSTELFLEGTQVVEEQIASLEELVKDIIANSKAKLTKPASVQPNLEYQTKTTTAHIATELQHLLKQRREAAADGHTVDKSLGHETKFTAWPQQQARTAPPQVRRVRLSGLSIASTPQLITSLVWGGRLEKIQFNDGDTFAWIQFLRPEDCQKFFAATSNGIVVPGDARRVVEVSLDEAPTSTNDMTKMYMENNVTRCVRAIGIDEDIGVGNLNSIASDKKRKIERVINGRNPSNRRIVEWRFMNIEDAFNFKIELPRDVEFQHCNIVFAQDPCEKATDVHPKN